MKLVIPIAGKGTRLRPHTHTRLKPLLHVAGKPIIGHILDRFKQLDITDVIFVYSHFEEQVKEYVESNYPYKVHMIKQIQQDGDGHAIWHAKKFIKDDDEVITDFADTLFEADLSMVKNCDCDGIVFTKPVDDPRRFGIVFLKDGKVHKLVEKPENPTSNLVNIGLYYFKKGKDLIDALDHVVENNIREKGEMRMVSAINHLVQKMDRHFKNHEVDEWIDFGTNAILLESQKKILKKSSGVHQAKFSIIIDPVHIEKGAVVENCIIGPFVSIAKGAKVRGSILRDSIVNEDATVESARLKGSLIGKNALVKGDTKSINIGDHSEISFGDSE